MFPCGKLMLCWLNHNYITACRMFLPMKDENRFDGRSSNYSLYRPDYPADLLSVIKLEFNMGDESAIADIGSGTGKLARLFLENGNKVFCIEPNREMREAAKKDLSGYPEAVLMDGSAEHTGLPDSSVEFIVVGQAFHWFDLEAAREEFKRILTENGVLILVWNDRVAKSTGINAAYEEICRKYSEGYHSSGSTGLSNDDIVGFFGHEVRKFSLPNPQEMNLEALKGRYFSAPYAMASSNPKYGKLLKAFDKAFKENKKGKWVRMEHETKVFAGQMV